MVSIGVDLVEIARMEAMLTRHGGRALQRLLTADEQAYCRSKARPAQHVATRVAAKEAAFKALQRAGDAAHVSWLHIEVRSDEDGQPALCFNGPAADAARRLGATGSMVTLSHSIDTAIAMVVLTAR